MMNVTITTEDGEILKSVEVELPDDQTEEDLSNEIFNVLDDFFDINDEL